MHIIRLFLILHSLFKFYLIFVEPPKFTNNSARHAYIYGSKNAIPCYFTGNPKPTFTVTKVPNDGSSAGTRYRCEATNSVGSAEYYVNVETGRKYEVLNLHFCIL